jgi:hypothetical protein
MADVFMLTILGILLLFFFFLYLMLRRAFLGFKEGVEEGQGRGRG